MDIKSYLDELVAKNNKPSFVESDPVQFPRRYRDLRDVEIVAFLTAAIAWGNRVTILRDAERMLAKLGQSPYDYVMGEGYEALGTANVHRTFFEQDMAYMLRGFRNLYTLYNSMDDYMVACQAKTPHSLHSALRCSAREANGGLHDVKCYPSDFSNSALKKFNLALRWLVRNDGIVDLGVWKSLRPDQLYIPLDVHVGNSARRLGLLGRKSNDWKAVVELTAQLQVFNPEDPVIYDFALFGMGVEKSGCYYG